MAKKEKEAKGSAELVVTVRKAKDAQHDSDSAKAGAFAWKLTRISMLLNLLLVMIIVCSVLYGIMKPESFIAATSNLRFSLLFPL